MERIRIVALVAAAMAIGGCSASSAASSATASSAPASSANEPASGNVVIHTFAFGPQKISVTAGSTVTWTNQDAILHTVTAGTSAKPEKTFDAKMDGVGSTFSFTFDNPGTYPYHCSIHAVMTGVVTVT